MPTRVVRLLGFVCLVPTLLFAADRITVPLTDADLAAIEQSAERRYMVGVTKEVGASLDLSGVRPDNLGQAGLLPFGRIERTAEGFRWTASIESPGAAALRVHFSNLFLPNNATLTIGNAIGESFAYTGRGPGGSGEFWSNTVRGDKVQVTVEYRGKDLGRVLQSLRLAVPEIGPLGPRFPSGEPQAGEPHCSNADCVENAECNNLPSAVATARQAVAMILFVSGPYQYICSGGLVADSDSGSQIPYFLTANHCLSKGSEASSLEAYFDYTSPCGTCDSPAARSCCASPSTTSSTSATTTSVAS
mgnify:CR=1 FL=1